MAVHVGVPVNNNNMPVTYRMGNYCVTELYNENNQLTEKIVDKNADGRPEQTISFEYDEAGHVTKQTELTNEDGDKNSLVTCFDYDKKGNMTRITWDFDADDVIEYTTMIDYDKRNRKTKETLYGAQGQILNEQNFEYKPWYQELFEKLFK